jgi:flavin-dependent dehydrogenase
MFVSDICIVGAGPAGSTLAARMAEFGHRVLLIERAMFPRAHLGESLSPGVLPLLEVLGMRDAIEAAGFSRVGRVRVQWDQGSQWRRDPRRKGLLVDRGRFDALLLDRAKARGVHVLQPAILRERRWDGNAWHLCIHTETGIVESKTKFLADASGRAAALPARRRCTGCRTLALYAYWRGRRLPEEPRIEAGAEAWYWGVPLPDGSYNSLVFVDVEQFRRTARGSVATRFHELIAQSGLMSSCHDARLAGSVLAADATPYVDETCITSCSIKVGDAALALDPLSSSGVQKAIQNALAGSVVVNTLLRKPDSSAAAIRFFRESVNTASNSHRSWAARHYLQVARRGGGPFWQERAAEALVEFSLKGPQMTPAERIQPGASIELSSQLEFVDLPCIEGHLVTIKTALRHPSLDEPLAFLGGWEIAPLLKRLGCGLTSVQVAQSWSNQISVKSAFALIAWLIDRGILVQRPPAAPDEGSAHGPTREAALTVGRILAVFN